MGKVSLYLDYDGILDFFFFFFIPLATKCFQEEMYGYRKIRLRKDMH